MKKVYIYLVLIMVLMAMLLCACVRTDKKTDDDNKPEDGWVVLSTVTPSDVYTKLLGGFTTIANDFSKTSIKTAPKLSLDSKLKLVVNGNTFWVTLKGNYLHTAPKNTMLALEISTEEDDYESNILEVYLHKEKLNIGMGETKISFDFPSTIWSSAFPFNVALESSDAVQKVALLLAQTVDVKDESIVGKTRQNGTIEEYNFDFNILLPSTLKKIFDFLKANPDEAYNDVIEKYGSIITNIFGVTMEEVRAGNFPQSTVRLNFTTASRKISAFKLNFDVDISKQKDTMLFPGEHLSIDLELINFTTSKKDNANIDFVNNTAKQNKYINYMDKVFNISTNMTMYGEEQVDYTFSITAKIFQEDRLDNFLFIEVIDCKNAVVKAFYFYKSYFYYYDWVDNKKQCVYAFPLDLAVIATKITKNDFLDEQGQPKTKLNALNMISYFIGSLRINDDGVKLFIKEDFFTNVWFNFVPLVEYVNTLFEEDLTGIEELQAAKEFVTENHYSLFVEYTRSLISIYEDGDLRISTITGMLDTASPLFTLTPIVDPNSDPND